jgi:hypothetical protein
MQSESGDRRRVHFARDSGRGTREQARCLGFPRFAAPRSGSGADGRARDQGASTVNPVCMPRW